MAVPEPSFSKEIDIVTGYHGRPHVTDSQDARRVAGTVGEDRYILDTGEKFAITVDSATQITISTGDAIICGRHVTIEKPITLPLKPGRRGMKRGVAVCLRVEPASGSGVDKAQAIVLDGKETSGEIDYPYAYLTGMSPDAIEDIALWVIPIDGTTVGKPEPAKNYKILTSISDIKDEIESSLQAELKADVDRVKTDVRQAEKEFNALNAKFIQLSSKPTVVYSDTTTETIRIKLEYHKQIGYTKETTLEYVNYSSSSCDFLIKVEKSHIIRRKNIFTPPKDAEIENKIKITFEDNPDLESWLKIKEVFPFYLKKSWEAVGKGELAERIDNARTRVARISFRVKLSHPMKDSSYSITGDWGASVVNYRTREDGDDMLGYRETTGLGEISYTKQSDCIDFLVAGNYVAGFLHNSLDYRPAILTIK